MVSNKSKKQRYNFLIDKSVYDDFSLLCDEMGFVRSKKLEIYMKDFIEQNNELIKELKNKK
jgi:hypothetical protein